MTKSQIMAPKTTSENYGNLGAAGDYGKILMISGPVVKV
jgi:hypothetical protein